MVYGLKGKCLEGAKEFLVMESPRCLDEGIKGSVISCLATHTLQTRME